MIGMEIYVVEIKRNRSSGWVACLTFENRCFDCEQAAVNAIYSMLTQNHPFYEVATLVPVKSPQVKLGRCWTALSKTGRSIGRWRIRKMTVETH